MIDLGFSSALNASSSFQTRPGRPPMNFKPLWEKKPKNFDKHEREGRTPDCPQNLRESPENPNQRRASQAISHLPKRISLQLIPDDGVPKKKKTYSLVRSWLLN